MKTAVRAVIFFAALMACLLHQGVYGLKVVKGRQHVDIKSIVRKQIITTLGLSVIGIQTLKMLPPELLMSSVDTNLQQIVDGASDSTNKNKFYNRGDELRKGQIRNWDWYKMQFQKQ